MEETVEILLAAYNGEHYLREQIESLLRQTWTHWHLTVSDDGSTDNTPAILDEYAARYPQRIRRAARRALRRRVRALLLADGDVRGALYDVLRSGRRVASG